MDIASSYKDFYSDGAGVDTLGVRDEPRSAAGVLSAVERAQMAFRDYQTFCDTIDLIYARRVDDDARWIDPDYDLFWASMEIVKPAVYAKPPKPVVSPLFKDRRDLLNVTAELLERAVASDFYRTGIDEAMLCVRDDLIFYSRGQLWLTYETDEDGGGQCVCVEHVDRKDFIHGPARKWGDVPWVAKRSWLTRKELRKRFKPTSGDAYFNAKLDASYAYNDGNIISRSERENVGKAGVWEVWHRDDNRVYWVCEGCSVLLDEGEPHLKLRGFFPCPRPSYGTLRPRTLLPVPDYARYSGHFAEINSLTRRIYALLNMIRMKGLVPSGSKIGDAVEQAMSDDSDAALLIPVPEAVLISGSNATGFVQWLPLAEIATAISGLIEARRELFSDYDRLSGISDIMRGETEADETLGAQQLKSQYGSVRVRSKIDELQRIARDATQIAAEIMAENFSSETLIEMSQMEFSTKAELSRQVKEAERACKGELEDLAERARQQAQQAQQTPGPQGDQQAPDPQDDQQAQLQQFQQAQQQILAKYQPIVQELEKRVPIEDVMKLLRDDRARSFAFEIETDSTVLTDELQEKASRNEFLQEFTTASQGLMGLATTSESGAKLAGELLKFVLQPYRVGRSLNSVIDDFVDDAPKRLQAQDDSAESQAQAALADANQKLAQAELIKARAKVAETQVKAQQANMDDQRGVAEMQLKMRESEMESQRKLAEVQVAAQESERKFAAEMEKLQSQAHELEARVRNLDANTQLTLSKIGSDARMQDREDIKTASDIHNAAQDRERDAFESNRDAAMGERQQDHGEELDDRREGRADRHQAHSERVDAARP